MYKKMILIYSITGIYEGNRKANRYNFSSFTGCYNIHEKLGHDSSTGISIISQNILL